MRKYMNAAFFAIVLDFCDLSISVILIIQNCRPERIYRSRPFTINNALGPPFIIQPLFRLFLPSFPAFLSKLGRKARL
jgi:hypothetical protein